MRVPHAPHILTVLATCLLLGFLLLASCATASNTPYRSFPRSFPPLIQITADSGGTASASAPNDLNNNPRLRARYILSPASDRHTLPSDRCPGGPPSPMGDPVSDPRNYQHEKQGTTTTSTSNADSNPVVVTPRRMNVDSGGYDGKKIMRRRRMLTRRWTKRGGRRDPC